MSLEKYFDENTITLESEVIKSYASSKKSIYSKRAILPICAIILYIIFTVPLFYLYRIERTDIESSFKKSDMNEDSNNYITVNMKSEKFDLLNREIKMSFEIEPIGIHSFENRSLSQGIFLEINKNVKFFDQGKIPEKFEASFFFDSGSSRDYPFDKFELNLGIKTLNEVNNLIPFKVIFKSVATTLNINFDIQEVESGLLLNIRLSRKKIVILYSILITIIMWGLSLSLLYIASDSLFYKRDIPPPLLVLGTSMLFALPALRNSQPELPSVGSLIDLLGFFWNMILVALSAIIIILGWAWRWRPVNFKN